MEVRDMIQKPLMRRCIITMLVIALAASSVYAAKTIGTVIEIRRRVYSIDKKHTTKKRLHIGDAVYVNSYIYTSRGAQCTIRFNNDDTIKLYEKTKIYINDVYRKGTMYSSIICSLGTVFSRITKRENVSYDVHTPTAVAGVRGTEFEVTVGMTGATQVDVAEGSVAVHDGLEQKKVAAGSNIITSIEENGQVFSAAISSKNDFIKNEKKKFNRSPETIMQRLTERLQERTNNISVLGESMRELADMNAEKTDTNILNEKFLTVGAEVVAARAAAQGIADLSDTVYARWRFGRNKKVKPYIQNIDSINSRYQQRLESIEAAFIAIDEAYEARVNTINVQYNEIEQRIEERMRVIDEMMEQPNTQDNE